MTVEEVVATLMRLARMDSGLPEEDREVLFFAHSYFYAHWDDIAATLEAQQK